MMLARSAGFLACLVVPTSGLLLSPVERRSPNATEYVPVAFASRAEESVCSNPKNPALTYTMEKMSNIKHLMAAPCWMFDCLSEAQRACSRYPECVGFYLDPTMGAFLLAQKGDGQSGEFMVFGKPPSQKPANPAANPAAQKSIFGPLEGDKIVLLIDKSGSMKETTTYHGREVTRDAMCQEALARQLEKLPDSKKFNVITYWDDIEEAFTDLKAANKANIADALETVGNMKPGGKTASLKALQAGYNMATRPDEIYFLSDGKPTDEEPAAILEEVKTMYAEKKIPVNTILVNSEAKPELVTFMKDLAAITSGTYNRAS